MSKECGDASLAKTISATVTHEGGAFIYRAVTSMMCVWTLPPTLP